jgi:hypothetical protein
MDWPAINQMPADACRLGGVDRGPATDWGIGWQIAVMD